MITALVVLVKLAIYFAIGHGVYRGWLVFSPPCDKSNGADIKYLDWGTKCSPDCDWHTNFFGFEKNQRWSVLSLFWWAHTAWPVLLLVTGVILAARGTVYVAVTLNELTIKQINSRVIKQCHKELPPPKDDYQTQFEEVEEEKDEYQMAAEEEVEKILAS